MDDPGSPTSHTLHKESPFSAQKHSRRPWSPSKPVIKSFIGKEEEIAGWIDGVLFEPVPSF